MKNILIILIATFSFFACEKTIELDVQQTRPVIVVEALVTNEMKAHYVKLTKSVGFYDEVKPPPVTDAVVTVSDGQGNVYNYSYYAEDSAYYAETAFQGIVGNAYTLEIIYDGDVITATDTLKSVSPIEEMVWEIDEDEQEDPEKEDYFYELTLSAREPNETVDYYLLHFFRNDSIQRFDGMTGVFYTDDTFIQEDIDHFPAPVYFKEGDTARFEMLSLTEHAYQYYNDLSTLLNNDGGMFGAVPANPYTNLEGENVVGCFQVSSVSKKTIVVGDPEFERND